MKLVRRFPLQSWNSVFIVSLMSAFLTFSTARSVDSALSTSSVVPNDVSDNVENTTAVVGQRGAGLKSVELDRSLGKPTYTPDILLVPEKLSNTKRDNTTEQISTDGVHTSDQTTELVNTKDNDQSTKFNYAILAALGALVLVIVLCIKCCNWFRAYTRAGDKDDSTKYAAIIHTGDDQYGHVDIQSDTASTVYLDTISSYQSFLKRNEHNSSLTSSKFTFPRQISYSPTSNGTGRPAFKDLDVKYVEMRQIRTGNRAETPDTCSPRSDSALSDNVRTFSVSSEETDPSTGTASTSYNEEINGKKPQTFKVSFTTERPSSNRPERQRSFNRSNLKLLPVDKHRRSLSCRSNTSRLSYNHDNAFRLIPIHQTAKPTVKGLGIDVATQTNRSFTYSRWKSRKRHYSDSGVDEMLGPPTINELSSICSYKDNCGHTCVYPDSPKLRTHSPINGQCDQNRIHPVLIEEVNKNRLTCENSISESESSDDVFATDVVATAVVKDVKPANDSDNSSIIVTKNNQDKHSSDHDYQGTTKIPINIQSSSDLVFHNKQPDHFKTTDRFDGHSSHSLSNRQFPLHLNDCSEVSERQNFSEERASKCKVGKSRTTGDMFLVDQAGISNKDNHDSYECDAIGDVTCSSVSEHVIPIDVYKVRDGLMKMKDASNNGHSLIIEQDLTSSMTSLESSGYAELSSDASTS